MKMEFKIKGNKTMVFCFSSDIERKLKGPVDFKYRIQMKRKQETIRQHTTFNKCQNPCCILVVSYIKDTFMTCNNSNKK